MKTKQVWRWLAWSIGVGAASVALAFGCSSSSSTPGPTGGGDDSGGGDASVADALEDHPGEGSHDGPPPDARYGNCEITGSFGSPCNLTATGPDPTDCTDPQYPICFVGGQGAWCTKTCANATDCTNGAEDAGCKPTGCNGRGYCN
jgi:hypothetical protein